MAEGLPEKKALKEGTDEESKNSVDSTLEDAERTLTSLRQTIAALDDFETRWKVLSYPTDLIFIYSLSIIGYPEEVWRSHLSVTLLSFGGATSMHCY